MIKTQIDFFWFSVKPVWGVLRIRVTETGSVMVMEPEEGPGNAAVITVIRGSSAWTAGTATSMKSGMKPFHFAQVQMITDSTFRKETFAYYYHSIYSFKTNQIQ